jgi:hypothetical protein
MRNSQYLVAKSFYSTKILLQVWAGVTLIDANLCSLPKFRQEGNWPLLLSDQRIAARLVISSRVSGRRYQQPNAAPDSTAGTANRSPCMAEDQTGHCASLGIDRFFNKINGPFVTINPISVHRGSWEVGKIGPFALTRRRIIRSHRAAS